jgi:hypothetical protein
MDERTRADDAGATEQAALRRVRTVSTLLDDAIRVPGTKIRFGLDPIIGLVPGIGDVLSTALSLYVVFEAIRAGVPKSLLAKMLALIAADAIVGAIPLVGPVVDAAWKANEWNVSLLTDHLEASEASGPQ